MKDDSFFKASRDFLRIYLPKQRRLSPNTVKSYRSALSQFLDFLTHEKGILILDVTLDCVTYENVSSYLDWLQSARNCTATTRNQRLMALRTFARYCSLSGIENIYISTELGKIPVQKVPGKKVDFLSEDAMQALLSEPEFKHHYGLRNGFFMILMYDTAARCQEMLDIRLQDLVIRKENSYVYLHGKGDKVRAVPLMEKTVRHLERYMAFYHPEAAQGPDDYLFYTVIHGERYPMSPDTAARFIDKYSKSAHAKNPNVPAHVHPHQFRHTRAIHLYRSGVPLALLSEYLGHSHISTTQIYAYASPEMKADAINKANNPKNTPDLEKSLWSGDEETIKRLYGLI